MKSIKYQVQRWGNGEWSTVVFFAATHLDAANARDGLQSSNPSGKYRVVKVETVTTEM